MLNRLQDATSPYLKQHADQPVHWQPWGESALDEAVRTDRPILLSIGYSTCHGCQVMAQESFADPAIAALMNASFVNIKVDREERPDLDRVYQLAQQLLNRQPGGWPLTLFLDPVGRIPFFAGTYFPRQAGHGLPGFADLLVRVAAVFAERRAALDEQCDKLAGILDELNPPGPAAPQMTDTALLEAARAQLESQYDRAEGGFGETPKFPQPLAIERLLLTWARSRRTSSTDREALEMAMHTLTRIARGGIFDHLGGGFFRYATDRRWVVPHFEKLLCDNGQLLAVYADACAISQDALFQAAVTGTADWLLRSLRAPTGAFHAAVAACTAEPVGATYLWRKEEAKRLLTPDEYLVVETLYGLDKPANCNNRWILHRRDAWRAVVERLALERATADELLASARTKLLTARQRREQPTVDTRILVAWNGLAVKGLARAGRVLERPDWIAAARAAVDFIREQTWQDNRLHASWTDGQAGPPGFLDDYVNLLDGLLELLRADWREVDAHFALEVADGLRHTFEDTAHGGFFFTGHDQETLIHRPKPTLDDVLPAGNGAAARVLLALGQLLGRADYLESARRTLAWTRTLMEQYPAGHCALLAALEYGMAGAEQIILRGPADTLAPWRRLTGQGFQPWRYAYAIPYGAFRTLPAGLPKLVSADLQEKTCAYWGAEDGYEPPITSIEAFAARLTPSD